MITTTIPNETVGLYTCFDENLPKATVEAEKVMNQQTFSFSLTSLFHDLSDFVHYMSKCKGKQCDALLVIVDEKGNFNVYDSLAQRGGKGLKKRVEVHRLKLFIALLKALPGLCTDLLSFLSSQIDDEPHPTNMPLDAISSKAAYKLLPESFKQLYKEIQTIQM
ncbi:MAG: hypothetical protein J6P74_02565 [Paludibacteraceae bacterium]|nr:hypothetical protein [Paludibacteraceae bacterium]